MEPTFHKVVLCRSGLFHKDARPVRAQQYSTIDFVTFFLVLIEVSDGSFSSSAQKF